MNNFDLTIRTTNELSYDGKLNLASDLYGFKKLPPTIDEFIDSPRYMGNVLGSRIYPYWREQLRKVYPNPIFSPYKWIIPRGAIGTGKSTFSMTMAAYEYCRLLHLNSPHATLNLVPGTKFTIRCFNLSKDKAYDVLITPLNEWLSMSPFFTEELDSIARGLRYNTEVSICPAKRAGDIISECLVYALISEVNFFRKDIAQDIIITCNSRMSSRLQLAESVFGKIILDSSSTEEGSVVEEFIRNCPEPNKMLVIDTSIWNAKRHQGIYFNKGSFKVYAGSDGIQPHIIKDDEDVSNFDKDRIITAPEELRSNFELDIVKALNDQAGVSVNNVNEFITNKDSIIKSMTLDNPLEDEEYIFDFFDDEHIYDRIGEDILSVLPEDRKLYCRTDLGLVTDRCGMAISYVDSARYDKIENKRIYRPKIKCPVIFGLSRKPNQETSIDKIIDFWVWLSSKRDIAIVTLDQYQSRAINQQLTKLGIRNKQLSVDRTDQAYVELKNLMLKGDIQLVKSDIVRSELWNLVRVGPNKVDHKISSTKDLSDALAGSIMTIIEDGVDSCAPTDTEVMDTYRSALDNLMEDRRRRSFMSRRRLV